VAGAGAVDQQVAEHVGARLIQRAIIAASVGHRLRDRGEPSPDGVRLHRGQVRGQPGHAVVGGFHEHAPILQRPFVAFGEGFGADLIDQRPHPPTERADRFRLRQHQRPRVDRFPLGRGEGVEKFDQHVHVPFRHPRRPQGVQHRRVPGLQGLRLREQHPRGMLRDP